MPIVVNTMGSCSPHQCDRTVCYYYVAL